MDQDFLPNDLIEQFEKMLEEKKQYYFDTEDFYEIIAYYLDVGDLPFAKSAIDYAKEIHPTNIEIKIKELEYFLEKNQLEIAQQQIQELQDLGNNDTDFLICMAKFWSLKEKPRKAIDYYQKALEFAEEQDYIHNCIGNEYLKMNELGKALRQYKKALELNLNDDFSFYSCLQCFDKMHLHKEAIEFLLQYIDLNPYSEMAWSELGQLYLLQKDFPNALNAFDYASIINSKSITPFTQKAYCYEQLGQFEDAIETYKEALVFDDSTAYTHLQIGKCYIKLDQSFKALKSFHKSLHEDPQLDQTWSETSDLYEKLGNYKDAEYYLQRAIEINGQNVDYIKRHAYLNIQLGMYEESIQDFLILLNIESENFYNWLGISELLITVGDYKRAIEILNQGIQKYHRAELFYQISNCYFLTNQFEKGKDALRKATKIDSNLVEEMLLKYPILEREIKKIKLDKKK